MIPLKRELHATFAGALSSNLTFNLDCELNLNFKFQVNVNLNFLNLNLLFHINFIFEH